MNKSEKIIVAILGLLLVGYFWHSTSQAKKEAEEQAKILHEQAAAGAQKPAAPNAEPSVSSHMGLAGVRRICSRRARASSRVHLPAEIS